MNHSDVILRPLITEKSSRLSERKQYAFVVHLKADKPTIRRAIENLFEVKVKSVNTSVQLGKVKRYGRGISKLPDTKKAVVTLVAGDSITLFGEN